jgi:hypothetical protein
MAEKLLFATAGLIINTLSSAAAKEIGLLWGVKDDIESLINTVSTIKDVLLVKNFTPLPVISATMDNVYRNDDRIEMD